MSLEEDLRTVLNDRAEEPTPRPDLLELVGAGVRRDRRRRTVSAIGAAALALAAVVAVPVVLGRGSHRSPLPPVASTGPSTPPAVAWDVPRWEQPTFPLAPGWLPNKAGRPEIMQMGTNVLMQYDWPGSVLSAEVGPVPGDWATEEEEEHAGAVGGRPATIHTASDTDPGSPGIHRYVGVRWRLADGQWAVAVSFGTLTEKQLLRFAAELHPGRVRGEAAPFTFAEVPPGLTLQHQSPQNACLAMPGQQVPDTDDPDMFKTQPRGLCVTVTEEPFDTEGADEILKVGGHRAAYYADRGIEVDLGGGRVLDISSETPLSLSRDDVIRFAAGVRVNRF